MDTLAYYRQGMELSGLSINWGAWPEGGMATCVASEHQNQMKTAGIGSISPVDISKNYQVLTVTIFERAIASSSR